MGATLAVVSQASRPNTMAFTSHLLMTLSLTYFLVTVTSAGFLKRKHRRGCSDFDLSDLVRSVANDLDGNNNGMIWDSGDLGVVFNNLDLDSDRCVTRTEWANVMKEKYDLSPVLANSSFPDQVFDSCPLVLPTTSNTTTDRFYYSTVFGLLDKCDKKSKEQEKGGFFRRMKMFWGKFWSRKPTDCACAAATGLCETDALVSGATGCGDRGVCAGKGTLGGRFMANLRNNDQDGNGVVTGPEIYNDLKDHYDLDQDDCVTLEEFTNGFITLYNFSEAYGRGRFEEDASGPCVLTVSDFQNNTQFQILVDDFQERNMEALVRVCQSLGEERFQENCDCAQLAQSCSVDDRLNTVPSCIEYVA